MSQETALANHILESIQKDLLFLKQHNYLTTEAYNEIQRNLPSSIGSSSPAATTRTTTTSMPSPASSNPAPPPSYHAATSNTLATVEALYDFNGLNPQDLSFRRGDIIQVIEYVNNDWWRGTLHGKNGLFPSNYVQKKASPPPPPPPEVKSSPPPPAPPSSGGYGGYPPPPPPSASGGGSYYPPPPPSASGGYPPPPPPPPPAANTGYNPPPSGYQAPMTSYSTAPPAEQPHVSSSGGEHSKWGDMLKKAGSNIGNAATWGFGAALGSEAAHSLF